MVASYVVIRFFSCYCVLGTPDSSGKKRSSLASGSTSSIHSSASTGSRTSSSSLQDGRRSTPTVKISPSASPQTKSRSGSSTSSNAGAQAVSALHTDALLSGPETGLTNANGASSDGPDSSSVSASANSSLTVHSAVNGGSVRRISAVQGNCAAMICRIHKSALCNVI